MNNKIAILIVTIGIVGAGILGVTTVSAQDADNPQSTIVQKIAAKFGLKADDVQAVFEEVRSERHTQMQARLEERLTQLVKDGKITEAQKQLIIDKRKELEASRQSSLESLKDLTPDERKAQMDAKRAELEAWAKANGIDPQYLLGIGGRGGHGMGKFGGVSPSKAATP